MEPDGNSGWYDNSFASEYAKLYGVKKGDEATIPHIMSLLFYTNFSVACFEFSASFRRRVWNETDHSLKRRHSGFAHQARLLRELVECFGMMMSECSVKTFYHGINRNMIFKSTTFKLCGPLSTTSDFAVAHGTFADDEGIVVDIWNDKKSETLFEALLWSDFHEESEYFFIGGLQTFRFLTIRDIPRRKDFKPFITPISMLQKMIKGYKFKQRAIKKSGCP